MQFSLSTTPRHSLGKKESTIVLNGTSCFPHAFSGHPKVRFQSLFLFTDKVLSSRRPPPLNSKSWIGAMTNSGGSNLDRATMGKVQSNEVKRYLYSQHAIHTSEAEKVFGLPLSDPPIALCAPLTTGDFVLKPLLVMSVRRHT